ncbi:MAG: HAD hydrolase-like protein, partial [Oscillospiraceae bacterium]|nr:HAD hydrolase-like protein [Oscillospiraceae bacterium]
RLTKACTYIRNGVTFYAVHEDLNCPMEDGYIPDCGSICALITASTDVTPKYFGKPRRETLDYIIEVTGYKEEELAFVGDRIYTDIATAQNTNAQSLMVLSGESTEADVEKYGITPGYIFSSVDEIKDKLVELYS